MYILFAATCMFTYMNIQFTAATHHVQCQHGVLSLIFQVKCFHKKTSGMDSIFRCQFPSAVVKDKLRLVYSKADLDDAFKDKRFGDHIKVELIFGEGDETNGISE